MKKSAITFSVIMAIGALWTGSAWYTGKHIESAHQHYVEKVNTKLASLKHMGIDAKIAEVKFERGIFRSQLRYDLVFQLENRDWVLPFQSTLNHGPFPLDRLSQFNLLPVFLSSQDQLVKQPHTQAWFDYAEGQNPFTSQIAVGYDQKISGKIAISPVEMNIKNMALRWKGISAQFSHLDEHGAGDMNLNMKDTQLRIENPMSGKVAVDIGNITLNSQLSATEWEKIPVGVQKMHIDRFKAYSSFPQKADEKIEYRDWSIDANIRQDGAFVNYQIDNKIGEMRFQDQGMGQLEVGLSLNHLEGQSLNALLKLIEGENMANNSSREKAGALLKQLLDKHALIQVSPLRLRNSQGKLDSNFTLEFANSQFEVLEKGQIFSLFKQLALNVDVEKAALEKFMATSLQQGGMSAEEADENAKMLMEWTLNDLQENGLFVNEHDNAKLRLILEKGELKLNGKVIPEDEVMFILLQFFLGITQQ
ncbi:YdgA family protein [Pasteurella sp. PK-2025]|uniref:YdgA family protein n=1 Tax=Pasteurella sp. PK-2025 TaxID=3413133 RepID=UPI003C722ECB